MAVLAELELRAGPEPFSARAAAVLQHLADAQRGRWALWLAPLLLAGICLYFSLPEEPPSWLGPAVVAILLSLWAALRRSWPAAPALIAAVSLAAGFAAAQIRTATTGTAILERPMGPMSVRGRIVEIAPLPGKGGRVLLEEIAIARLAPEETPRRVRIRIASDIAALAPGDRIEVLAELLAPPPPAAPGAFDYQRQAWFAGIGAVGFAYGVLRDREPGPPDPAWSEGWNGLRHAATRRILAALPGEDGAVAAALMTGHQGAIPADVIAAMRDSGLAHLLSISGLHIGLIAGILLFTLRAGLALIPWLALRIPTKKVAAVVALAGTGGYVLLAGATVPTLRAFLMTAIVMLAILTDRSALTMRLVAAAAAAVALIRPEAVLGASFQMSFAAVTALIAAHEVIAERRASGPRSVFSRVSRAAIAIASTSLIAGAATAPFGAYHFHRLADYGVLANMAAVPITGFWVMPLAALAFLLMPFGLEDWALEPMGWGIAAIVTVARQVAALPGAAILVPEAPAAGLAAFAAGGVWLCLWRGAWRWLGALALPMAAVAVLLHAPADLLVSADGTVVALRDAQGQLRLSDPRKGGIAVEAWLERGAQAQRLAWAQSPESGGCDGEGCRAILRERSVSFALTRAAAAEDCGRVDLIVVARFLPQFRCRGSILVDRGMLWRGGAHALWLDEEGVRIETVRERRGERPWVAEAGRPQELRSGPVPWPDQ